MKKLILLILCFCLFGCSKTSYLDNYITMTKEDYNMQYELNDENNSFISIDFNEFKYKITNEETFVFYFGGSWCRNCRAVAYMINDVAKLNNFNVYNFDPRNGDKEAIDDFRKCNTTEQELLYKEFIELLKYENEETVRVEDENGNIRNTNIPSLAVPAVMAIKNGIVEYILIEEYEEDEITVEIENHYKNELQVLINKL